MKLLFIGDIFGRSGRDVLKQELPKLIQEHDPDLIVVNGENAAHGKGLTPDHATEFFELGADVITTGNHVWDQRQIIPYLDREPRILRPFNFPEGTPGQGMWKGRTKKGDPFTVVNLMGRLFMDDLDCPYQAAQTILNNHHVKRDGPLFIDFHAEATSEKNAMGHLADGTAAAVIGTHTHIPTADTRILEKGTAFQTDAGMTGDYDSVIGIRKDIPVNRFLRRFPGEKPQPATGKATLCGVLVEINVTTGLAKNVQRIQCGALFNKN